MSDVVSPTNEQSNKSTEPPAPKPQPRKKMRLLGALLIVFSALLGWFLIVGYLGWQSGQTALNQQREVELAAQLARQLSLAKENMDQGSYNLALRRLDYVLERDPSNQEAKELQQQAQAKLADLSAPQAVKVTATQTPEPLPSATPGLISDPDDELQRIRRLSANKAWDEALPSLISFQQQFPNFERQETDQLLYDAYIEYGLILLEGEKVELGLNYLEQAEKLGDLSQEVLDYQFWAELYLQGIGFYAVNWSVATFYFRELCASAPFYQGACDKLKESLVNYGDQYAGSLDWCPAIDLYQEALQYGRTQLLVEKLSQAREECLLATPTPSAPITDTVPIEPSLDSPFILTTTEPNS